MILFLKALGLIVIFVIIIAVIIGKYLSAPPYKGPITDHFDGKQFINYGNVKPAGFSAVPRMLFTEKRGPWKRIKSIETAKPSSKIGGKKLNLSYIGHSSFLIQVDGYNILTDPVWSDRVSPFSFMGPKRFVPPGIKMDDLPEIDLILLTHNHYDHMDVPALKELYRRFKPEIFTTLGNQLFLEQLGFGPITELDWWETAPFKNNVQITCTPAQHFSSRGLFDRNKTLWGGFHLATPWGKVFYVGDTGYGEFIKDIGERLGPMDLALVPIAAYKPRYFMGPIHVDPIEAVQVHEDIQSKQSIACHFGTFNLAFEGMTEPLDVLKEELIKREIPLENFTSLRIGEIREFNL